MPLAGTETSAALTKAMRFPEHANSGSVVLVAGTATVSFPDLTANSQIFLSLKDPSVTTLTVAYCAPSGGRTVGTGFVVRANVAAGTINVADLSTLEYLVIP